MQERKVQFRSTGQRGTLVEIAFVFGGQYVIRLDSGGMVLAEPTAVDFVSEGALDEYEGSGRCYTPKEAS